MSLFSLAWSISQPFRFRCMAVGAVSPRFGLAPELPSAEHDKLVTHDAPKPTEAALSAFLFVVCVRHGVVHVCACVHTVRSSACLRACMLVVNVCAVPCRALPCRALPSRAVPCRAAPPHSPTQLHAHPSRGLASRYLQCEQDHGKGQEGRHGQGQESRHGKGQEEGQQRQRRRRLRRRRQEGRVSAGGRAVPSFDILRRHGSGGVARLV